MLGDAKAHRPELMNEIGPGDGVPTPRAARRPPSPAVSTSCHRPSTAFASSFFLSLRLPRALRRTFL